MRPSFYPRIINGPFEDPGVFVPFVFENRAIIFDVGDIRSLSARDILKTSHVFVSHTHMDHFSGFDTLLRLFLGREKDLYVYGPEGFLKNIEGKLAGYSWNLVEHYTSNFVLHVTEVRPDALLTSSYPCRNRFVPLEKPRKTPFDPILHTEPALSVAVAILDHSIPSLAFSLREQFHVNIIKDQLEKIGLGIGPWIRDFKQALFGKASPDSLFEVPCGKEGSEKKTFALGYLAEQIAIITPGQKITYVTDAVCSESNAEKIVALAEGSDYLFIEAAFLEEDRDMAREKYHLTAWQAGTLAREASVKQFVLFHFSPRYTGMEALFEEEAERAWKGL